MQARCVDPITGRFLSKDPVKFVVTRPDSFNRYSYAANDPVNAVDADGEFWHIVGAGVLGGVVGAAVNAAVQYKTREEANLNDVIAAAGAIAANPALAAIPAAAAAQYGEDK